MSNFQFFMFKEGILPFEPFKKLAARSDSTLEHWILSIGHWKFTVVVLAGTE